MFRGKNKDMALPTSMHQAPSTLPSLSSFASSNNGADGSGKNIRMEAPIARAWRSSSGYTKGTYYAIFFCIALLIFGIQHLRSKHASVWLVCHSQDCTFTVTPLGLNGSHKVQFPRRQLVLAEPIKTDQEGNFVAISPRFDDFQDKPTKTSKQRKKAQNYRGPDMVGHYPSFRLTLRDPEYGEEEEEEEIPQVRLDAVKPFMEKNQDGHFTIILRKYKVFQTRRRIKSTVQKIDSYIKNRRQRLVVKESSAPAWPGILCVVVGVLGVLLSTLLGQFWDPSPTKSKRMNYSSRKNISHNRMSRKIT